MRKTEEIRIEEYNYNLPEEQIAKFPLERRDSSKLLQYKGGEITQYSFGDLPSLVPQDALMVFNNTKVIQARLYFQKATGAKIEIFCLEPICPNDHQIAFQQRKSTTWLCMVGNLKKWKEGALELNVNASNGVLKLSAKRIATRGNAHEIEFSWEDDSITFAEILDLVGELPIPPYLNRSTEESDKDRYQTMYSKVEGSVAAPTAGLHFTPEVMGALQGRGVELGEVTLHVGAGTFQPVKSDTIGEHEMHTEFIVVNRKTIEQLISHIGRIVAVGTTSVRTIESLYYIGLQLERDPNATAEKLKTTQWMPYKLEANISSKKALENILLHLDRVGSDYLHTSTQIMIAPGYEFNIVNAIVTNFHQPQSTLLLLVSAFLKGDWKRVYDYALANNFRFLSYGDSSLLIP
ncbi:MAG: S-adenosylmethionine:tRNA ribosyltransferase-isomerase [Bacteroidales bacterium]